ncbi:hypothetical protein ES708_22896 [subsurface metagenome]
MAMTSKWMKRLVFKLYTQQPLTQEEDSYCMELKDELKEEDSS